MEERASRTSGTTGEPPLWRRPWVLILGAIVLLLIVVGVVSGDPENNTDDRAARDSRATPTSTVSRTPTPDPEQQARAAAAKLVTQGRFAAAAERLENVGLLRAADRVLATGARALYRQARRALNAGRYKVAKRLAVKARDLQSTGAITALITHADSEIAAAREAARIARDQRTCSGTEKASVRAGSGVPAGCDTYAAELSAQRAQEAAAAEEEASAGSSCAPGYSPCIPPYPPDLDCADVGPVTVTGSDPHGLDADHDGVACGGD
jgi:hypothetical protein